jgi:hypothetical protein
MALSIGPGISFGGGISLSVGEPPAPPPPEGWQTYWYTDFNTGTFEKTAGIASTGTSTTGDVWFDQNSGSVSSGDAFEGTHSYFCDSVTTPSNRLRALVNREVVDTYSEFKIEFQFRRTNADSFPTLLFMGGTPTNTFPAANDLFSLRWLANATAIGRTSANGATVVNSPAWATVGNWNKIAAVYNRVNQTGEFVVNDVTVLGPAPMEKGWLNAQTSPNRVAISWFQYAYDAAGDNGIAGYLDNLGLYVKV